MATDIVRIAELAPADRDAAIVELTVACEAIGRADLAPVVATRLGKAPDGFVVEVRRARHAKHYDELQTPAERLAIDANRHASDGPHEDDRRWLEADVEWRPLAAGVSLLASPESPEREIERRHAIVEARRAEEQKRDDEIAETKRKQEAARAEWRAKHGRRDARFRQLPLSLQLAFHAADRLPSFIQSIVVLFLTEYTRASEEFTGRRLPPLPDSFPAIPEDARERTADGRLIER